MAKSSACITTWWLQREPDWDVNCIQPRVCCTLAHGQDHVTVKRIITHQDRLGPVPGEAVH